MSKPKLKTSDGIKWYTFRQIDNLGFVTHAFSTRLGGVSPFPKSALNLGYAKEDSRENVQSNRLNFVKALGWEPGALRHLKQVHSNVIHVLDRHNRMKLCFEGDGLATAEPGVLLAIQVADCFPIVIIDPDKRIIANVHAGWRGTVARIVEKAIVLLSTQFKSSPANLVAAIGPGIGGCCYEVGEEVIERFYTEFNYADKLLWPSTGKDKAYLNLLAANSRQLLDYGLKEERILAANSCTACRNDLFFSHRYEKGKTGRMMAVVGINPPR